MRRATTVGARRAAALLAGALAACASGTTGADRGDARDGPAERGDAADIDTLDAGAHAARDAAEDADVAADLAADRADAAAPDAADPAALAPDPSCAHDGCLRAAEHLADVPREALLPLLPPGATIAHGYAVWVVEAATDGRAQRATVTLPLAPPPARGWDVVANAHGTTGVGAPCALAGTEAGAGLAGYFGARGLIGVAPDYPGPATGAPHPYLVWRAEGRAVLDGLRAAAQLARWRGVPLSRRFAAAGLSQGGHAVLGAAAEHATYAPELDVRAFAAAAPASVFEEQWRAGVAVDGPHLVYHALVVWAWSRYHGYPDTEAWAPALAGQVDALMASRCVYSPVGAPALADALPTRADALFSAAFLAEYRAGQWRHFSAVHQAFELNRVRPYRQTAPLLIVQGTADTTVLEGDTRAMVTALRAGGVAVDHRTFAGAGHTDLAFGFLASPEVATATAVGWIHAQLGR